MVFLGSWLCLQLLLTKPPQPQSCSTDWEGHSWGVLRVPGGEQQEYPWMLPPELLLSGSQCQQMASTSCRGGIPVPRAWPGLHPQASNTRAVSFPLLVAQLLQAQCFHLPLLMAPQGQGRLFRLFLCCAAGDDKRRGGQRMGCGCLMRFFLFP